MNYNEVDAANRVLDQQTDDFHLEKMEEDDEKQEAEEAAERKEEYYRIYLHLLDFMKVSEARPIASKLMSKWTTEEGSYYRDESGFVFLFYQNFQITKEEGQWMFSWQEDESQNFAHADPLAGLEVIDGLVEQGVLQ